MRIAQIAPLYEAVPPRKYGGTERIVSLLTDYLVARGHDVTLFASGDSRTTARLIPCTTEALRLSPTTTDPIAPHIAMLARVQELAGEFDVIHNHVDYLAYPFIRQWRMPTVTTLHGRLDIPELPLIYRRFPDVQLVSISDSQRDPLAPFGLRWVGRVYNAVDCRAFHPSRAHGDYLAFLGRVSVEKRPDLAVEVARRAGMPLKIAAKIDPRDREWHREHLAPLLDDPLVEFIGEVDDRQKAELLSGAAALIFPSSWPEPFGLAMIEAMACGTPVVALRYGAVPEVVADGTTGFICDSVDEMVAAVNCIDEIDRAACRARVEEHFSVPVMGAAYEAVYEQVSGFHGPVFASTAS
ncbi:MAG TPA: glycosyltransferase family 4 protein [Thermomicrobiales bacterium]|nr:glycosyltransferase family 4 protein [Thermomicrobiales bacterium]